MVDFMRMISKPAQWPKFCKQAAGKEAQKRNVNVHFVSLDASLRWHDHGVG